MDDLQRAIDRLKDYRMAAIAVLAGKEDAIQALERSELTHGDLDLLISALESKASDPGIPIYNLKDGTDDVMRFSSAVSSTSNAGFQDIQTRGGGSSSAIVIGADEFVKS